MSFGSRLAGARRQVGLTQQELGRGLGTDGADVSKSVVYGWEKDQHHPRADQLVLLCERLSCSADYLLFGRESQFTPAATQIAGLFDRIPDPRVRANMEIDLIDLIVSAIKQRDPPPTDNPGSDQPGGTQRGPGQSPKPIAQPKPATTGKNPQERSEHKE